MRGRVDAPDPPALARLVVGQRRHVVGHAADGHVEVGDRAARCGIDHAAGDVRATDLLIRGRARARETVTSADVKQSIDIITGEKSTAYLRQVRLSRARQLLEDSDPGDGVTVTRVAIDWGFLNSCRFASYYRTAYGENPSVTLARCQTARAGGPR